ncbi:MAG: MBL fold metallo-hydrolase [Candidatus Omnitrophica bacterium]|nr:MBL fold metallo-hydrolase [Candidatus Omnitrophota bacterium]
MSTSIQFCGGAGIVTGSMHLVSVDRAQILLDCGLFQGRRDETHEVNSNFIFNPQRLRASILSHAHIDHCGNIPTLIKKGYRSHIFATPPTKRLCNYMIPDSGYVQEEDIKYVNKINKRKGIPPRFPLYTKQEAENSLRYIRALEYNTKFALSKEIDLTFFEAGHILGSAVPVLDIKISKGRMRIAYAVDLGRYGMPLLRDPEIPKDIDYLIIESTYGGRKHSSIQDAEDELAGAINRAANREGKIIIPSFALERTQLIVFFISELIKRKKIQKIPIYVDSPLAVNLTKVFRKNWEYFDEITRRAFRSQQDPLGYDNITYITNVNSSKKLNDKNGPIIIISASGMCENGRIRHHLKNNIESSRNMVIVIGFMAKNTLGRRIVDREKVVRIFGTPRELNAEVVILNAFSSHADETGLVEYVKKCRGRLKEVFIVHGEEEQSEVLKSNLKKLNFKVRIPVKNETVHLSDSL